MMPLVLWSIRAAVAIALGLALTLLLRRRSAAVRSLLLRTTLVVALSLPLVALFAPRLALPLPAAPHSTAPVPVARLVESSTSARPGARPVGTSRSGSPAPTNPLPAEFVAGTRPGTVAISSLAPALAASLYLLGVVALVGRWLAGFARLRRITRAATPFGDEPDVLRGAIAVPATYGRTILLPLAAEEWPEARVRAAILHERAHLRRRDWAWQSLAALFAAVHWANPAAWILARLLRDTAEAAADDEALAGMTPSDYARELLAVARDAAATGWEVVCIVHGEGIWI